MRGRGLTLAEVLLAMGILAAVTLSIMAVFIAGNRTMRQSRDLTTATEVGREFLETVKFLGYDNITVGTFEGTTPDTPDSATGFPPAPYPLTRRENQDFVLKVVAQQHSPVTRLVKLEVRWQQHRTSFATMVHMQ